MNPESIKGVLVFGAGSMGEGISQVFAQAGLDLLLVDIDQSALERCKSQIGANLISRDRPGYSVSDVELDPYDLWASFPFPCLI